MSNEETSPPTEILELQQRVDDLRAHQIAAVTRRNNTNGERLAFRVDWYITALAWRMLDIGSGSLGAFKNNYLVSGTLLSRSGLEVTAAAWHLVKAIELAVRTGSTEAAQTTVDRLSYGFKMKIDVADAKEAINVLTLLDQMDKEVSGIRQAYDSMSEIAHPNWAGTSLIFSKPDEKSGTVFFGSSAHADGGAEAAASALVGAIDLFLNRLTKTRSLLPALTRLGDERTLK